jgi:hypothetical protein
MADIDPLITAPSAEARATRRAFGLRAHAIENNPLDAEQIALFAQFDRDSLTDEQRRAILIARAKLAAG